MMSKTIHFWMKPIAKLLEVSVSTYVREKSIAADDAALGILKIIDVVLGGDHGQGKFRPIIKGSFYETMVGSRCTIDQETRWKLILQDEKR
jgi:hypothetical protein